MYEVNDILEERYPILHKGNRIRVQYGNYSITGATLIRLIYWDENLNLELPFVTVTVNAEGVELEDDEVIIKDYAENEGLLKMLIDNDIVNKPHGTIPLGFDKGHICQLIDYEDI